MPTGAAIGHVLVSQVRGGCVTGSSTTPNANHLPLYRQAQIFSHLDRSTLADRSGRAAFGSPPAFSDLMT